MAKRAGRGRPRRRVEGTDARAVGAGRVAVRTISASEAAKNFGALVDRVREERAAYVVERSGVPVVRVVPVERERATVADLVAVLRAAPSPDPAFLDEVERGVAFLNKPAVPRDPWAS